MSGNMDEKNPATGRTLSDDVRLFASDMELTLAGRPGLLPYHGTRHARHFARLIERVGALARELADVSAYAAGTAFPDRLDEAIKDAMADCLDVANFALFVRETLRAELPKEDR
jgi:hypothetical protein